MEQFILMLVGKRVVIPILRLKNDIVKHGAESLGWGAYGGNDATVNSQYVYFSTAKDNEGGGLSGPDYPPAGRGWTGILRVSKADFKKGAPFTGGKGKGTFPNSMLVVYELDEKVKVNISGIYATEKELFISVASHNFLKVYDASTMVFKREFSIANPHQIGMDTYGNLWVGCYKIKRYSPTGLLLLEAVNLPAGSFVGDFCIDKNDRILIGDVGKREQVLIYTDINTNPAFCNKLLSAFKNPPVGIRLPLGFIYESKIGFPAPISLLKKT